MGRAARGIGRRLSLDLGMGGIGISGYFETIPSTFAARHTLQRIDPRRPPRSSSGSSTIEASCWSIRWARWRACSWRERLRSRAIS